MSKSLARVKAALAAAGLAAQIKQMADGTRTAAQAAVAAGVPVDQIVKSILFSGGDRLFLFLTAGGNQVDPAKASALAQTPLSRAEADQVRRVTGFAIGGVAPIGHLTPSPIWLDPRLLEFDEIWAAAGTPHHIFPIAPATLLSLAKSTVADFTSQ